MLLFMYMKGRSRPIAALFDTGCSTILVRRDVIGTELIAAKIKEREASLKTFNTSSELLDKYAILVPKADNQGAHLLEGYVTDEISYLEGTHTQHALRHIKNCDPDNQELQKAKVHPQIGGHIDLVIGVKYLNLFPELVYNSNINLGLYKLRLQPHYTGYYHCLAGNNPFWREIINEIDHPAPINTPPPVLECIENTESTNSDIAKLTTGNTKENIDSPSPTIRHVEPTYSEIVKLKTMNAKNTKFTEEDVKSNQTNPQTEHSQPQPANDHQTKLPIFIGSYQLKGPSIASGTKFHPI